MKTDLNFEEPETKKLLVKLDFEYFLQDNCKEEKYPKKSIDELYSSFERHSAGLRVRARGNRLQLKLYAEGQVRKMFTGGLLPTLFHLNDMRGHTLVDFSAVGENWAYFNHWQRAHKRILNRQSVWTYITRVGAILGIALAVLKILEYSGWIGVSH